MKRADWVCENARIERIGYFIGLRDTGRVPVRIVCSCGGHCKFDLKTGQVAEFLSAIECLKEDGVFIEDLVGTPFCAWFANNGHGRIVAVSSILDQRGDELFELQDGGEK